MHLYYTPSVPQMQYLITTLPEKRHCFTTDGNNAIVNNMMMV